MLTLKPILLTDIDFAVSMMQEFYAIDSYKMEKEISKNLFLEFLENKNLGQSWFILFENKIVGYLILTFVFSFEYQGKIAFIDELYINKNYRNNGFGKQTVLFAINFAKQNNLKILYLETENHNEAAQNLYLSSGFNFHNRKIMIHKLT